MVSRRVAACAACGQERQVIAVLAIGPVCSTCYERALCSKGRCEGCGATRRIDPRNTNSRPLCSDCAGLPALQVCAGCGDEDRLFEAGRCRRCVLGTRLAQVLGVSGDVPAGLRTLFDALVGVERPKAALRWLARPEVHRVLAALGSGELEISHEALDGLPPAKWLDHLRQVLVATGTLPARDEALARLERWIRARIGEMDNVEDRRVIEAYAIWWVLRRQRQRATGTDTTTTKYARANVTNAIGFVAWLRSHGRTLATCRQADVDLWLASGPPTRCRARAFLRWATARRLVRDVDIVRRPDVVPARSVEAHDQAALVQRFLTDAAIPLVDRVAGLLVLLYGQALARVARLDVSRVRHDADGTVLLALGRDEVRLPPPVGALVAELVATRRGRATVGAPPSSPWLFPGIQPGRPLRADRLRIRLNAYGLRARAARTTALLDLATEVPPVVLADLLGMYPNTAVRWVQAAGGEWANYAAIRARQAR
ncbi:MAG TPA: hypothetical protein VM264_08140 [Acidimicrobiales bacterium]|nr:hypothetical protein [Acidimicrobiales bacterium]